ncbi:hypothetical protein QC762_302938 [Podospora pseudocomata]|uniref:SprT-like domain-containing protein n=1 Tax=Podospora pseudocomata TaxID=2093779 RepID=A0ABR0GIA3_9PEZI|nr:hypothetical protein QC762_302938 [Podospora pseudocomata]
MAASVDRYLTKIRAEPPTIIVSDRIEGEGETIRLQWINVLREADYIAKMAVFFRLYKMIIENAIHTAGENNANELRGFLFLMGLSVAHELIHTFVGPAGRRAYFNPRNPRGTRQVGDMVGVFTTQNTGRAVSEAWMHDCLGLNWKDFTFPVDLAGPSQNCTNRTQMEGTAQRKTWKDRLQYRGDYTPHMPEINHMPLHRISSSALRDIMRTVANTAYIKVRA